MMTIPDDGGDSVERGMLAVAALRQRNAELERATNDAVLAIKARDIEIENLRLQLAERDNRLASIQATCDERLADYQRERDALFNDNAEYRAIHQQIKHLYERIDLPLPRGLPRSRKRNGPPPAEAEATANSNGNENEKADPPGNSDGVVAADVAGGSSARD